MPLATLRALNRGSTLSLAERQGLRTAEEWLLAHQISDGAWFTAFPTFFGIMAMHELDPVRYRAQILMGFVFSTRCSCPTAIKYHFS